MPVDLTGAADLHAHFGPDPHRTRSVTGLEAAQQAAAAGHAAIEVALRLGARIVWLPTLSSAQDVANGVAAQLGIPGPGLRVTDDDDRLTPETEAILDLVAEFDAVLATGHVSAAEHLAVTRAYAGRGKVLVTHAMEELAGPNLDAAQCAELAALGAHIELCALTCVGALATRPVDDLVACIRAVGIERVTLGTDFGQGLNEPPAAGLQTYADALFAAGLTEAEIRRMAGTNPNALLARDG